jgi:acyl carrier protein
VTRDEIREVVVEELCEIAPEADPATLRLDVGLRDQLDIDSMDFLNFIIAIDEKLGVSVPEADYSKLPTLDALVDYLGEKLSAAGG